MVTEPQQDVVVLLQETHHVITTGMQGPAGKSAPIVSVGGISTDPGNDLTTGTDGGLYVPDDIPTDPLAYYILARS